MHEYVHMATRITRIITKVKHNRNEAINKAIDYCIENDILAEILKDNRAEVLGMFLKSFARRQKTEEHIDEYIKNIYINVSLH